MKPICSVCQSDLLDDELDQYGGDVTVVKVAPCGHVYHRHCVQNLHDYHERTNRNREPLGCPICRQVIVSAEGELQWEPIFLSAEDEAASQRRPAPKTVALSTKTKAILALAKELNEQSRDALAVKRTVVEQDNLRKSVREGVFQQLADWGDRLEARLKGVDEAGAVELLADNLREWQTMCAAIIEACEETRKLPEVLENYKSRVSSLQTKVRENEAKISEQTREHRREKVDSAARFRQKEVDLAQEYRDKEIRLKTDFDKEVQIWRTKFQTAQESGNNAATALHEQTRQTAALTEQLDAAKNEENLAKGSLQRLRHKLAKKQEEYDQAQTTIDTLHHEIDALQGQNLVSARRIQEMSAQRSSRHLRDHGFSDDDMHAELLQDDDSMDANEESLFVEAPNFDTPSRRKQNLHPTLRVLRLGDFKNRENQSARSNVIAFASDEEQGADESLNKRIKTVQGHARNPFATVLNQNNNQNAESSNMAIKQGRFFPGGGAKSRLVQDVIVVDDSSDPPEAMGDEVEVVQVPSRRGPDEIGRQGRLAGGKRHVLHPKPAGRPVAQGQTGLLGNRASGPRMTRRAV